VMISLCAVYIMHYSYVVGHSLSLPLQLNRFGVLSCVTCVIVDIAELNMVSIGTLLTYIRRHYIGHSSGIGSGS
jgi:hypothetical protein